MSGSKQRLVRATRLAERRSSTTAIDQVIQQLHSTKGWDRLVGLIIAQTFVESGAADARLINEGERLLNDPDEDCMWQAGILLGLFISRAPDRIWQIIQRAGKSTNEELRMVVATTLLEHLIEHDLRKFEPKAKALARRSKEFAATLRSSWYTRERTRG